MHQNGLKSTVYLPELFDRGFLRSEIVCLWSLPLAVVICGFWFLFTAFFAGMKNSHQGRHCGTTRNHASAKQKPLSSHLPHHEK